MVVVELVALGLANNDIGHRLHLSGHTVAGHVASAMHRLLARTRAELVARAYVNGLLATDVWPPRSTGRRCFSAPLPEEPSSGRPVQIQVPGRRHRDDPGRDVVGL